MFIYSVRAGTLKFVGAICVALVAMITLIAFLPGTNNAVVDTGATTQSVKYEKVKDAADVAAFGV